jgi:hypothetical protein
MRYSVPSSESDYCSAPSSPRVSSVWPREETWEVATSPRTPPTTHITSFWSNCELPPSRTRLSCARIERSTPDYKLSRPLFITLRQQLPTRLSSVLLHYMFDPNGGSILTWGIARRRKVPRHRSPCSQITHRRWGCEEVVNAAGTQPMNPFRLLRPLSIHSYTTESHQVACLGR